MKYSILVLILFVFISSCSDLNNNRKEQDAQQLSDSVIIDDTPIFKGKELLVIQSLRVDAKKATSGWPSFNNFNAKMSELPKISRDRLFSYLEELETLYEEMFEQKFPEKFDLPQVKSRLLVVRTYLLKLKAKVNDQRFSDEVLQGIIKELVAAHNNMLAQINDLAETSLEEDEMINID